MRPGDSEQTFYGAFGHLKLNYRGGEALPSLYT